MPSTPPSTPWTWDRLRRLVAELGLEPGSYAAGPTAVLLMDGTLQEAQTMQLLVTDELYERLASQGWTDSGFELTSPAHPGLSLSKVDLTGSLGASPDELIRLAEPVYGVQVPPRELLQSDSARIEAAWAEHLRQNPPQPGFFKRHRRVLVPLAALVGLAVLGLVAMNIMGGYQHLFGGDTTKVQGVVVEVHEGGPDCSDDSDYSDEPYTIVYGWVVDGEPYTAERERCRDEPPEVGDPQDLWIDDDNELVSTSSPAVARVAAILIVLFVVVAVVGFGFFRRRRSRRGRGADPGGDVGTGPSRRTFAQPPAAAGSSSRPQSDVPPDDEAPGYGDGPESGEMPGDAETPAAWRPSVITIVGQVCLVVLGMGLIYYAIRLVGTSLLAAGLLAGVGLAAIVIAQPWIWIPRSRMPITMGTVDGRTGLVIPQRPPSMFAALGLAAIALLVIAATLWYTVAHWGDEDSGYLGALVIGGLGGIGFLVTAWTRIDPDNRKDLDVLVTAEGIRYNVRGERAFLAWDQISEFAATRRVGSSGARWNRSGFGPQVNLIQVLSQSGESIVTWKCRYLRTDPVEALELLRRKHREATGRSTP